LRHQEHKLRVALQYPFYLSLDFLSVDVSLLLASSFFNEFLYTHVAMFMGECEGERIEEELVNYFPTRSHLLTIFSLERPSMFRFHQG